MIQLVKRLRVSHFLAFVAALLLLLLLIAPALAPASPVEGEGEEGAGEPTEETAAEESTTPYYIDSMEALREMEQQRKDWRDRIAILESDIKNSLSKIDSYQAEIAALDAQQVVLAGEIQVMEETIDALTVLINEAVDAIAEATERLQERQAYLESRLRELYVKGDVSMMDVFFQAGTIEEFLVLYYDVERIMVADRDLLDEIAAYKATIEAERQRLEDALAAQKEILDDLEIQKAELERLQGAKEAAMSQERQTVAQAEAIQAELEAADSMAEAEIAAYRARNPESNLEYSGIMSWPLPHNQKTITSNYGYREHPILGGQRLHAGVDVGAPNGTYIYAAAAGEIIYQGWLGGYGNAVMIDHGRNSNGDEVTTLYGHMSNINYSYSVGDIVITGDLIGYVGSTGQSTGNHLHFEVRLNGTHTDPQPYLGY